MKLEMSKMLTINLSHISPTTATMLLNNDKDVPAAYSKSMKMGEVAEQYGIFVYVGGDVFNDYENMPSDLVKCIKLAKDNGCDWLCFDVDGQFVEIDRDYYEIYQNNGIKMINFIGTIFRSEPENDDDKSFYRNLDYGISDMSLSEFLADISKHSEIVAECKWYTDDLTEEEAFLFFKEDVYMPLQFENLTMETENGYYYHDWE